MDILLAFFGMPGPMELLIILAILVVGFPAVVILVLVFWVVPWDRRRARQRRLSSGKAPTDPKDPKCPPENPPS